MCTRSANLDCQKRKSNQSKRGLILFLVANDKSILHHDNIHKGKLKNLLKITSNNIFSESHIPDRVIFNFSSYKLTDDEKNLLCKGLNFSVKPGLIDYSEFLLPFELLFRDIKREDLSNENMSAIKTRLLETALTSYQNFSSDRELPENLTSSEFKAVKRLSKNTDIPKHNFWGICFHQRNFLYV